MAIFIKARIAFCNTLFEADSINGEGGKKHGAAFLYEKDSEAYKKVNAEIERVAKDKWGPKAPEVLKALRAANKVCCTDGDSKAQYDGYAGNYFTNASRNESAGRPIVKLANNTPATPADGKPYAGCYVIAKIEIWAQDNKYGKRINATLEGVQFERDGDAFSGTKPASDEGFENVEEGADADVM